MLMRRALLIFIGAIILSMGSSSALVSPVGAGVIAQEPIIHIVAWGETLSLIARQYGTSVGEIVRLNRLSNPSLIYVGQRLIIPTLKLEPPAPAADSAYTYYAVAQGDTLYAIAAHFGVSVGSIVQANSLSNPNLLRVGQQLRIPTAVTSTPTIPSSAPSERPIHIVQRGETLSRIALRYGLSTWALGIANNLVNPSLIYPGQRLILPSLSPNTVSSLIAAVELVPPRVAQGHTLLIRVHTQESANLSGVLDGRPLTLVGQSGWYWAVAGFAPWAVVGPHVWTILATASDGRSVEASGEVMVVANDFPIQYITLPPDRGDLLDPALVEAEWQKVKAVFAQISPTPLWEGTFRVPVEGQLTSFFGTQRSYNGGPVSSYHMGTDYAAGEGDPVWVANSGRVILAESLTVRGNTIIIDHGLGVHSAYFHLSRVDVQVGQVVKKGDGIGAVGSTGLATGPHLHWEMRIAGIGIDPTEWTERSIPG